MKFLKLFLVISTIFFNYVASSSSSSDVERCITMRAHDNEKKSWNEWENLHSLFVGEARAQVNMTNRNLHSINQELLKLNGNADERRIISMDLSINRISVIENGTFERFHNLRVLMMRVNSLREITASQFKGLMVLEELDLSRNAIYSIERDALRHMERLRTIDLSGNCLFNLRPYIFFRNLRLININFNRNFLETLPILMPFSQRIDNLNVTANRFTNLTSLIYYDNIQSMDVSHNPLNMKEMSNNVTSSSEGSDSDSSSSSGEVNNYTMRVDYNLRSKFIRHSHHHHHRQRRFDESAATVNSIGRRRARAIYNDDDIQSLMDIVHPKRISEEALQAAINESKAVLLQMRREDVNATEMHELCNALKAFYRNQNRNEFMSSMGSNCAALVRVLSRKLIRNSRNVRSAHDVHYVQLSAQQMQQLQQFKPINRLEYFTCQNCSLHSLDFLVQFPNLKYVDVTSNMIKSVDASRLASLEHIEYLDISHNNALESISITELFTKWPSLRALVLNNNRGLKCDLLRHDADRLNKNIQLDVNACT